MSGLTAVQLNLVLLIHLLPSGQASLSPGSVKLDLAHLSRQAEKDRENQSRPSELALVAGELKDDSHAVTTSFVRLASNSAGAYENVAF